MPRWVVRRKDHICTTVIGWVHSLAERVVPRRRGATSDGRHAVVVSEIERHGGCNNAKVNEDEEGKSELI
jgi:hypothetical protein